MKSAGIKGGHRLCLAVALALGVVSQAQAIGLGAIEVKSPLGKPFVAEIPITLSTPNEADDLSVRLASPEAFARVGLERPNELSANLQFSIGKNARGEPVVRISTPQPMTDPYVSFLLEADWGRGKMVREYTALLDPPRTTVIRRVPIAAPVVRSTPMPMPMPQPTPVVVPTMPATVAPTVPVPPAPPPVAIAPATPSEPVAAAPIVESPPEPLVAAPMEIPPPIPVPPAPAAMPEEPAPPPITTAPAMPEPPPAPVAPEPEPAAAPPAPPSEPVAPTPTPEVAEAPTPPAPKSRAPTPPAKPDTHTVARGETLAHIAGGVHGEASLNRMMIALQRANPDAFIDQNINLLKSGSVLRIPANDEVQTLTADEANLLVQQQVESWRQSAQPPLQPTAETVEIARPAEKPAPASVAVESKAAEPAPETVKPAAPRASKPKRVIAKASTPKPASETAAPAKPEPAQSVASKPAVAHVARAHLEIVPPMGGGARGSQTGASAGGSGSELRAELAQTKEDLATRNAEVGELKSRVADLEKMQQDNQSLLSMKDSKLAAMQQRLAELEKNAAATTPATSPGSTTPAAPAIATSATPATAAASTPTATTPPPVAATAAPKPASTAKPIVAPPAAPVLETPWFQRPLVLIGGALLLLGGLLGLMLRRRRPDDAGRASRYSSGTLAASLASARATTQEGPLTNREDDLDREVERFGARDEPATTPGQPLPASATTPIRRPYWTGSYEAGQTAHETAASAAASPAAAVVPESKPAAKPTTTPKNKSSTDATAKPTSEPAAKPSAAPAAKPSAAPAAKATLETAKPVIEPIAKPIPAPTTNAAVVERGGSEPASLATAVTKQRPATPTVAEGDQGVATKIELARAYIDIGDAEGARGMLEEVLMEGTDSQRADALKLLETLG